MRKKKNAILLLTVFCLLLLAAAFSGSKRGSGEFGQIKGAMREIRRVDNLQYTYANTISDQTGRETSRVDVWSDQLTGRWRADYYTIDEDGMWMFLQEYCDGKEIYHYNGNNELQLNDGYSSNRDLPNFGELVSLEYDSDDILEETCVTDGDFQKISHVFTIEYMMGIMEQYQNAKVIDARIDYWIDKNGILQKKLFSLVLMRPQTDENTDSAAVSEEQEEIHIDILIEVQGYNQDGIIEMIEKQ